MADYRELAEGVVDDAIPLIRGILEKQWAIALEAIHGRIKQPRSPEWIDVKDGLPDSSHDQLYVIEYRDKGPKGMAMKGVAIGTYIDGKWFYDCNDSSKVTKYLPIPSPIKNDERT